jgi:hypothetical protein
MPLARILLIVATACLVGGFLLIAGRVTGQIEPSKTLVNVAAFFIWLGAVLCVAGVVLRHRKSRPAAPEQDS